MTQSCTDKKPKRIPVEKPTDMEIDAMDTVMQYFGFKTRSAALRKSVLMIAKLIEDGYQLTFDKVYVCTPIDGEGPTYEFNVGTWID